MSQRIHLNEEPRDEFPHRVPAPWRHLGLVKLDPLYHNCAPCQGFGWEGFLPSGGKVCRACGGSGHRPNGVKAPLL